MEKQEILNELIKALQADNPHDMYEYVKDLQERLQKEILLNEGE